MHFVYLLHIDLPKQVRQPYVTLFCDVWNVKLQNTVTAENKQIVVADRTNTSSSLALPTLFVEQMQDALFVYADKIRSLILKFPNSRKALCVILFLSLSITMKK